MKTLIIGGTGLISTAITRQLVERGDDVVLYNRGRTPSRVDGDIRTIAGDRGQYEQFEAHMAAEGPFDCVIDMVAFKPQDVESAIRAFRGRAAQYILCSTVCVYGGPASRYPIREDEPRTPTGGYGERKAQCEDLALAASQRGELPATVMRPSQSYGEGGTIVHSMGWSTTYIDRIRKGKPVVVHGDGQCLWAACHVDDVARGFVGAAGNPKAIGRSYNVTGEEWMTWNRYHQAVSEALNAPVPTLVHIPSDLLAKVAPKRFGISIEIFQWPSVFDNSAAMADLGFRYTIPWVEGVRRTVAWLDANGKIEDSDQDPYEDRLISAWEHLGNRLAGEAGE